MTEHDDDPRGDEDGRRTDDRSIPPERSSPSAEGSNSASQSTPVIGDQLDPDESDPAIGGVRRPPVGGGPFGGLADRQLLAKTVIGFIVAALAVYLLGYAVGWKAVLALLAETQLRWVAIGCVSTAICLAMWGKAWQVVLSVAGVQEPYRRLVVTYFAATFANYVTPLGQAGGEPFIAYVLSRDTEATYQDSLAFVVTADLLNLLPFFNFAAVGLGWLLLRVGLPEGAEQLAWGLVVMAVGVPVVISVGWRYRTKLEVLILRLIGPIATRTGRFSTEGVRLRIEEFFVALERIAASPRKLATALLFSYLGWVFFTLPLYFGALALGFTVNPVVILFIVPASTLAGLVPTPGGLGSVEAALVVLLVALTTLIEPEAFALAVVYRVASFYFSIAVGAIAAIWVTIRV